jgi:hypothetical protein
VVHGIHSADRGRPGGVPDFPCRCWTNRVFGREALGCCWAPALGRASQLSDRSSTVYVQYMRRRALCTSDCCCPCCLTTVMPHTRWAGYTVLHGHQHRVSVLVLRDCGCWYKMMPRLLRLLLLLFVHGQIVVLRALPMLFVSVMMMIAKRSPVVVHCSFLLLSRSKWLHWQRHRGGSIIMMADAQFPAHTSDTSSAQFSRSSLRGLLLLLLLLVFSNQQKWPPPLPVPLMLSWPTYVL